MLTMLFKKAKLAVVLLLLSNVRYSGTIYCTQTENSIKSMMLRQYVFKTFPAPTSLGCLVACEEDVRCQSFNYVITRDICELNNRTKEARPEHFIFDVNRYYYGMVRNRVPLGSIPELPAQSCREIKASEGQHAVSGSYWIELIHLGKIIHAECDMDAEDINECSSTDRLCDFNANCTNTIGSYRCSCLPGFTGDGKNCADIDECSGGNHTCDRDRATCTNTIGSYKCACKYGYDGDGETCIAPECLNYQAITTQNGRKNTYVSTTANCDNNLFGWHRFEAATGTKMPTSCVPSNRCNTHAPGWLNGDHPTVAEGLVTRQVCFSYYHCCSWSINIQVRNCGDFYIYNFKGTPPEHPCSLRYCSTD